MKTKAIAQERVQMAEKVSELTHQGPEDLVLNLAQLTNALILQVFKPHERYPALAHYELIEHAVANQTHLNAEVEQRKAEALQRKEDNQQKREEKKCK
ncbi:hypothetical protein SCP_1303080 [Sparassis crispa]|uniref:Uncharacterized protein n=1 Tax=Sparassis crispa TaxID=139825 RepID=A0A401H276_9APHY|nr:hypothetical protein SCP_1303080 [Sparassis crispa]GBE88492.1 hypothetical protein SCP_1303080 [Sparassis crispa]